VTGTIPEFLESSLTLGSPTSPVWLNRRCVGDLSRDWVMEGWVVWGWLGAGSVVLYLLDHVVISKDEVNRRHGGWLGKKSYALWLF